jgi:hypothetical protein
VAVSIELIMNAPDANANAAVNKMTIALQRNCACEKKLLKQNLVCPSTYILFRRIFYIKRYLFFKKKSAANIKVFFKLY